jgi:hypothetical protein
MSHLAYLPLTERAHLGYPDPYGHRQSARLWRVSQGLLRFRLQPDSEWLCWRLEGNDSHSGRRSLHLNDRVPCHHGAPDPCARRDHGGSDTDEAERDPCNNYGSGHPNTTIYPPTVGHAYVDCYANAWPHAGRRQTIAEDPNPDVPLCVGSARRC